MNVGDLIKTKHKPPHWGIVAQIKDRQVECLWHDGDISWCMKWQVEAIWK